MRDVGEQLSAMEVRLDLLLELQTRLNPKEAEGARRPRAASAGD